MSGHQQETHFFADLGIVACQRSSCPAIRAHPALEFHSNDVGVAHRRYGFCRFVAGNKRAIENNTSIHLLEVDLKAYEQFQQLLYFQKEIESFLEKDKNR